MPNFSNLSPVNAIVGAINDAVTTITVDLDPVVAAPFAIVVTPDDTKVAEEIMLVTAVAANGSNFDLTVTRAHGGTTAKSHLASAVVAHVVIAGDLGTWVHETGYTILGNSSDNVGIGVGASPSARLHVAAGTATAGSAPIKLTSGTLLATSEAGAIEFNADTFYGTISSSGSGSYTAQYPSAHSDTYVKATTKFSTSTWAYYATDPALSLTGGWSGVSWLASGTTNQRFHIDLGSAKTIKRIYYENFHDSGANTNWGANAFTFWGSNSPSAFAELTYGTDTDWTQLTTSQATFDQHAASNAADPKYITVTNATAYRYYAIKIASNHGGGYLGLRHINLQTEDGDPVRAAFVQDNGTRLVSGRVPYASTGGRLVDLSTFAFDGTNLGVGTATPSAKIHALATTLQQRWGYDGSNYLDLTIGSSGLASWSPTGAHMNLASGKNLLIGGTTAITTGTNSLGIFTGTAPTAVAADSIALYSSDLSAGNTIPSIWTEGTGIYAAGTPAAATGSIALRVNGTVYHFTVSTSPAA